MSTLTTDLSFAKAHPALFVNAPGVGFTIPLEDDEIQEVEVYVAQGLEAKGMPTEWAQVGIAYQDQDIFLLRDAVRFPDGTVGTYIRFADPEDRAPGVIVLPLYQGQVLLIRHFRHATRTWHLEIPRGFGRKGLTSEESVSRELEEEIGATPSCFLSLGQTYPNTGMSSERDELFFAEVGSYGHAETQEAIAEILPTPLPEFERMLRDNEITDGFTLAAYARAKLQGLL